MTKMIVNMYYLPTDEKVTKLQQCIEICLCNSVYNNDSNICDIIHPTWPT